MSELLVTDIATFIHTNIPSLIYGTSIFIENMPDKPDDCVGIYEVPGLPDVAQVDYARRIVTIMCRSMSILTALKQANTIRKCLVSEDGILQLTSDRWTKIDIQSTAIKIKTDEKARVYYGFSSIFTTYID